MGVDPITPAITPSVLVNDFINTNINDIVNLVFPLQKFGFLDRLPSLITMDLHNFLLTLLQMEYGTYYIDSLQQKQFKTTYTSSFYRLIQLMSLDQLVDMNTLLRNQFQSEEYVANVSQSANISEITSEAEENVEGNTTIQNQSNSTTDNNYRSGSRDDGTASGSTTALTTYGNNSQDTSNTSSTSIIGATSGINVALNIPLPTQTISGSTSSFPQISGTSIGGANVGVPQLNQSFSDSATQSNNFTSSQTNSDTSTGNSNSLSQSNTNDTSSNQSQSQTISNSYTDGSQSHIGTANMVDSGLTTVNTESTSQTTGKQGSSGFVGSRRKGFTTNAIVATQLLAMFKGYQEIPTALEWWLEQFRWIEPFIGMDYFDTNMQQYV